MHNTFVFKCDVTVLATGKMLHYKMRANQRGGRFTKKYDEESITAGGYVKPKTPAAAVEHSSPTS